MQAPSFSTESGPRPCKLPHRIQDHRAPRRAWHPDRANSPAFYFDAVESRGVCIFPAGFAKIRGLCTGISCKVPNLLLSRHDFRRIRCPEPQRLHTNSRVPCARGTENANPCFPCVMAAENSRVCIGCTCGRPRPCKPPHVACMAGAAAITPARGRSLQSEPDLLPRIASRQYVLATHAAFRRVGAIESCGFI